MPTYLYGDENEKEKKMTTWILILIVGSKTADYPSVNQYTFASQQGCYKMLRSLKNQRPDVSGECVANEFKQTVWISPSSEYSIKESSK